MNLLSVSKTKKKFNKQKKTKKRNKNILRGGNPTYICDTTTKLGEGGYGYVLACKDTNTNVTIAVKFAKTEKAEKELKHEIEMYDILSSGNTQHIGYNNIVKMIEHIDLKFHLGETVPNTYLALEYCNNGDLHKMINTAHDYNITDILEQVFNGMRYLFENQILHLDLKPGNILVHKPDAGSYIYKITDFGLARYVPSSDDDQPVNLRKMLVGTPVYKPTYRNIDRSTFFRDLYSLFCIIYYLYFREHYNVMPEHVKIEKYESKPISKLKVEKQKQISGYLNEIIELLKELEVNVLENVKNRLENVQKHGTAYTPRWKAKLNISGFEQLNTSMENIHNEPTFDKVPLEVSFYDKYYNSIQNIIKKNESIVIKPKPLVIRHQHVKQLTQSLSGTKTLPNNDP